MLARNWPTSAKSKVDRLGVRPRSPAATALANRALKNWPRPVSKDAMSPASPTNSTRDDLYPAILSGQNILRMCVISVGGSEIRQAALNGLNSLSGEVAAALSKHHGELHLEGLASIDYQAATEMRKHCGSLYLRGLKSISDSAAAGLSNHTGYVELGCGRTA